MAENAQRTYRVLRDGAPTEEAASLKRYQVENLLTGMGIEELSNEWHTLFKGSAVAINGVQIQLEVVDPNGLSKKESPLPRYSLSPEMAEDMVKLEKRGRSLGIRGTSLVGLGAALAVGAGVVYSAARSNAPSAVLKALDVPEGLYKRFSDVAVSYGNSGSLSFVKGRLQDTTAFVDSIIGFISGPVTLIMGGGAIFAALGFGLMTGNLERAFRVSLPIFVLAGSMQLTGIFAGTSERIHSTESEKSERVKFANAVEEKDTQVVTRMLGRLSGDWKELYVTAQLYLLDGTGRTQSVKQAAESLRTYSDQQLGFTPSGDVAYAIEQAADGSVRTAAAQSYYQEATQKAANGKSRAGVLAVIAAVTAGLGCFLVTLAVKIRRRVKRIKELALA